MYHQDIKASLNLNILRQRFITSMKLWQQWEALLGCFLDSLVMNMARGYLTVYQ